MERLQDRQLLEKLFDQYKIQSYFETDFKDDLTLVRYDKGEVMYSEGDPLTSIQFMVGGKAKVSVMQENGKTMLICFIEDFEIMGEIELFAESDFTNHVITVEETYCLRLDLRQYRHKLMNDPVFTKHMAGSLAKIVLNNNDSASFNLLYPLENRMATYILSTAEAGVFKDNLTTLAELMATSYRHLQRVLVKLCDSGMLSKEGRSYKIMDEDGLKKLSNETFSRFR